MTRRFIPPFLVAILLCAFVFAVAYAGYSPEEEKSLLQAVKDKKWDVVKEMVTKNPGLANFRLPECCRILHCAVAAGRKDVVEVLLQNKANINAFDGDWKTPVFHAVERGDLDLVKFLVAAGANLDMWDIYGCGVVYYAAQEGRCEVLKFLLQKGMLIEPPAKSDSRPKAAERGFRHPFHIAIVRGHTKVVGVLIKNGINPNHRVVYHPLIIAAGLNRIKMAKFLLENGANANCLQFVNCKTVGMFGNRMMAHLEYCNSYYNVYNALDVALFCDKPNLDLIGLLLEKGTDINYCAQGQSLLYIAIAMKLHDAARFLIDKGIDMNSSPTLEPAIKQGDIAVIDMLLSKGAKIVKGTLRDAIWSGNLAVVDFLIKKGADVNELDVIGRPVLYWAIEQNQLDMVKLLLSRGAKVNTRDVYGRTVLDVALQKRNKEIISVLRAAEAKTAPPVEHKYTGREAQSFLFAIRKKREEAAINLLQANPALIYVTQGVLYMAVQGGMCDLVAQLIAAKADVNDKDGFGCTPLYYAVGKKRNFKIAKLLLDNGANVNAKNDQGATPLFSAVSIDDVAVAALLLKHGADMSAVEKKRGRTALFAAQSLAMIKLLVEDGADINARDDSGKTPLTCYLWRRWRRVLLSTDAIASYYRKNGAIITDALLKAVVEDDAAGVRSMKKVLCNMYECDQHRLFNIAIVMKNLNALKALVDNGLEIPTWGDIPSEYDETLLVSAVHTGSIEVVRFLAEHGGGGGGGGGAI